MILPSRLQPLWDQSTEPAGYEALRDDVTVDVAVVGAGITGLTAAMHLHRAGADVMVVETSDVGAGATGHSTGHLSSRPDEPLHKLIRRFGLDKTRRVVHAMRQAIDQVRRWDIEYELACQFERLPGYLYTEEGQDLSTLRHEIQAVKKLGIEAEVIENSPLPFPIAAGLRFEDQGRIQPLQYVRALARRLSDAGVAIHGSTHVQELEQDRLGCTLVTNRGKIHARAAIIAVHAPLFSTLTIETRAYPWQSYVLAARVPEQVADALYWDTFDPYHYTRRACSSDPHLLIIGGADHRTGQMRQTDGQFEQLERYARRRYSSVVVESHWSHEFFEPADGLPYIGRLPRYDNAYIATGFDGDGLTFGTIAGALMADLAMGRTNEWQDLFAPSRLKPMASAGPMLKAVARMARHYVAPRLVPEADEVSEVPVGEGRIIRLDGEVLAVYRDEQDQFHAMSAVCTHAGCIVAWNGAEKTWDCPCHGGRYDAHGRVIASPPPHDLAPRPLPQVKGEA